MKNCFNLFIKIPEQIRFVLIFLFITLLIILYVFVYNQLLIQNVFGPYIGAPLALCGELLFISIIASLSLIFSQRGQKAFLTGFLLILTLIYISVLLYYREFRFFPTISLLDLAFHRGNVLKDVTGVILSLVKPSDLILPLLLTIWVIIVRKVKMQNIRIKTRSKGTIFCIFFACLIFAFYKSSFNYIYKNHSSWHQEMRPNPDLIISHIGYLPFCLEDFFSFYKISKKSKTKLSHNEKTLLLEYYQSNKTAKNDYTGRFEGFNLFLLQFESLSNIVINLKINGHEVTPTLNRLTREGIYFPEFYTQEGAGPTTSSEFVTLNSIIAPTDSFVAISYRFNTFHTLATLFKEKGYYTFAIHGNDGSYYNREFIYEQYGFNDFFSKKDIDGDILHRWIGDKDLLNKASDIAIDSNSNFFGFPIMVTSHKNWDILPVFDLDTGLHPFSDRAEGYVKNINYSDQAVQLFLDQLEDKGLLDNTIIMIYGDHSPQLKEKEVESIIGYDVTDFEYRRLRIQIPFIIWAPKQVIEPQTIYDVFPQIDVLPTICNLFNLGQHFGIGKDIFNTTTPNTACTQEFYVTNNAVYKKFNNSGKGVVAASRNDMPIEKIKSFCDTQITISDLILKTNAIKHIKISPNIAEKKQ